MMSDRSRERGAALMHDIPNRILKDLREIGDYVKKQEDKDIENFKKAILEIFPETGIIKRDEFIDNLLKLRGPNHFQIKSNDAMKKRVYKNKLNLAPELFEILDKDAQKKIRNGVDELITKLKKEEEKKKEQKRRKLICEIGSFVEGLFAGSEYELEIHPISEKLNKGPIFPKSTIGYPDIFHPFPECESFPIDTFIRGHAVRLEFLVENPLKAKIGFRVEDFVEKTTGIRIIGNNGNIYEIGFDGKYSITIKDSFGDHIKSETFYGKTGVSRAKLFKYLRKEELVV